MGSCHSKGYGDCQPESADNGNVHHIWKRFLSSTSNLEFGGTCNPTLDVTCANHLTRIHVDSGYRYSRYSIGNCGSEDDYLYTCREAEGPRREMDGRCGRYRMKLDLKGRNPLVRLGTGDDLYVYLRVSRDCVGKAV